MILRFLLSLVVLDLVIVAGVVVAVFVFVVIVSLLMHRRPWIWIIRPLDRAYQAPSNQVPLARRA